MLSGYGAGMDATASAVMGDVLSIARDLKANVGTRTPALGCPQDQLENYHIKPMHQVVSSFYMRCTVKDQPGVLSQISGILGKNNISIESMVQPHRHSVGAVPIVFVTHEAQESDVAAALQEIDNLDVIQEETLLIRIENQLE
jgi:homoserine dehydrogenase